MSHKRKTFFFFLSPPLAVCRLVFIFLLLATTTRLAVAALTSQHSTFFRSYVSFLSFAASNPLQSSISALSRRRSRELWGQFHERSERIPPHSPADYMMMMTTTRFNVHENTRNALITISCECVTMLRMEWRTTLLHSAMCWMLSFSASLSIFFRLELDFINIITTPSCAAAQITFAHESPLSPQSGWEMGRKSKSKKLECLRTETSEPAHQQHWLLLCIYMCFFSWMQKWKWIKKNNKIFSFPLVVNDVEKSILLTCSLVELLSRKIFWIQFSCLCCDCNFAAFRQLSGANELSLSLALYTAIWCANSRHFFNCTLALHTPSRRHPPPSPPSEEGFAVYGYLLNLGEETRKPVFFFFQVVFLSFSIPFIPLSIICSLLSANTRKKKKKLKRNNSQE